MKNYLVFDFGGTYIKYAIMNEQAHILTKNAVPAPKKTDSKDTFLNIIDNIVSSCSNISGIAISSPGIIDSTSGIIHAIGAYPYLRECPLKQEFEERYKLPCAIENDAKSAALAELWQGNLKGIQDGAVWIIGTSIGGGIILDGKLRRGQNFFAGEFSGMFINIYNPDEADSCCAALGTSTLCQMVSSACHLNKDINGKEAFTYINNNHPGALKALSDYTDLLAREIFSINLLLDIQKICIGGGISEQPKLIQSLKQSIQNIPSYHSDMRQGTNLPLPVIDTCKFHNDANLIGALYHMLFEKN